MPELFPEIASERILDVVTVRSGRILVLTDAHVAMLKVSTPLTFTRVHGLFQCEVHFISRVMQVYRCALTRRFL